MTQGLILATICLPWLGGLLCWLVRDKRPRLQHLLAVIFSVAAGLAALILLGQTSDDPAIAWSMGALVGTLTFVPDGLGVFLAVVATVVGSLAVIFSVDYMSGSAQLGRYYALVLYFIGAMAGLALTGSLLFLFIFWEITAFCSYALISFYNDDPKAVAGGIKALIVTQIGGLGLLAGALLAYAYTGDYQIAGFLAAAPELPGPILTLMAFGFIIAAAAKSAQVPFHTWLPDAMEAPTPVSALIHAATMVNAGVYLLARFYPAFAPVPGWQTTVVVIGLLSAVLAAIMALVCNDLKRVLAYSTISQLGYMFYGIGVGAILASQVYLLSHAIFKALLFLGAGAVIHTLGTRDMREMGGLGKEMPLVRAVFIIGSLALVGLPLANGFFSKEMVLEAGLTQGPIWAYLVMLVGVVLTAIYTTRMVSLVFYGRVATPRHVHDAPTAMRFSLIVLAVGTLTSWLLLGPFNELLAETLPFHRLEEETTAELVGEVISAPATWLVTALALAGVLLVIVGRVQRRPAPKLPGQPAAVRFVDGGLGFEDLNRQIIHLTRRAAAALSLTQTGQLNWNIAYIALGLVILGIILYWSA